MTKHPEIFAALAAPFEGTDVKQRDGQGRNKLSYITARTVMNRLDEVLGPEGWDFELRPWGDSLIGTLIMRMPDGAVVKKSDAGGRAGMKAADDDAKSAGSDCLKRCGAMAGVGRYLYNDGQVSFGTGTAQRGQEKARDARTPTQRLIDWCAKEGHSGRLNAIARSVYNQDPGALTDEQATAIYKLIKNSGAVADVQQPPPYKATQMYVDGDSMRPTDSNGSPVDQVVDNIKGAPAPGTNSNGNPVKFGWPHSGVSLFAWMKNLEKSFGVGIIDVIRGQFCGDHLEPDVRLDPTFRSWNPAQVEAAAISVAQGISTRPGYSGEFDKRLPLGIRELRDKLWATAGDLCEALGQQLTAENIETLIQQTSQSLAHRFGGEVIGELGTCGHEEMLRAILEVIEGDVRDSKTLSAEE